MRDDTKNALSNVAGRAIESARQELVGLAKDIHAHPELNYQEFYSANLLASFLEQKGIEVERGVGQVETAFRATLRGGAGDGPTVAIIAEYDALPEIGPRLRPQLDRHGGHGSRSRR